MTAAGLSLLPTTTHLLTILVGTPWLQQFASRYPLVTIECALVFAAATQRRIASMETTTT
jgi:hypothetical protein